MTPDTSLHALLESARHAPAPEPAPGFETRVLARLSLSRAGRRAQARMIWLSTPIFACVALSLCLWHLASPPTSPDLLLTALDAASWTAPAPLPLEP